MKHLGIAVLLLGFVQFGQAQKKMIDVPQVVKTAFEQKFPEASKVTWEKEKGNFEANWGGKSGEDNSVLYSPDGIFVESVVAMPVADLPSTIAEYVHQHYPGKKITEAGKGVDAKGSVFYEAEVARKDLVFDVNGKFLKVD